MSAYRTILLLLLMLLNACASMVMPPKTLSALPAKESLAAYARVLQRYVNARGEVDFPALQKQRTDLDTYITYVAQLPARSISDPNERLAHYLNSYNALSMYNVLESGIPQSNAGFAKMQFFYWRQLPIGGEYMSLYDYENNYIRVLKEPLVHFALNCSARSCPVLPRTPFTGDSLQQVLVGETRKFFAEQRNFHIDHQHKKVYLSELLDFYPDDFISADTLSLIAYVNQFIPQKIPQDYCIEYIPYDWTIANSAR